MATGDYFREINTVLPELQDDISLLADFADTYDGAADDLLAVLDNLAVTNTTIVDQAEQLRRTFTVGAELVEHDRRLPRDQRAEPDLAGRDLAAGARAVFAEYSPMYTCLLEGLARPNPMIAESFGADGDPALNLNIVVSLPPRNPYMPGDQPAYARQLRARLPWADQHRRADGGLAERRVLLPRRPARRRRLPGQPVLRQPELPRRPRAERRARGRRGPERAAATPSPVNLAGSTAELDFVRSILGYQTGTDPDRGLRPVRLDDGAAAARDAGDVPMTALSTSRHQMAPADHVAGVKS